MFSGAQLAAMAFSVAACIGCPLLLVILWRRKSHAPWRAVIVGAAMFVLFALVLEQILHILVLRPGGYVLTHAWAYVAYGSLAAALFEETGRLVGFRFLLKKQSDKAVGVMYGIGHGGMEAIFVGSITALMNLITALQYNAGTLTGGALAAVPAALASPPSVFMAVGLERMVVICFHIALSVLVFQAVKRPGKMWMYPAAILLHVGLDIFAGLYQYGLLGQWCTEAILVVFTVLTCLWVARIYRKDAVSAACPISAEAD